LTAEVRKLALCVTLTGGWRMRSSGKVVYQVGLTANPR